MQANLLNTQQAAEILGVNKAFLERDRWAGARVPFIKVGLRAVRYRLCERCVFYLSAAATTPQSTHLKPDDSGERTRPRIRTRRPDSKEPSQSQKPSG